MTISIFKQNGKFNKLKYLGYPSTVKAILFSMTIVFSPLIDIIRARMTLFSSSNFFSNYKKLSFSFCFFLKIYLIAIHCEKQKTLKDPLHMRNSETQIDLKFISVCGLSPLGARMGEDQMKFRSRVKSGRNETRGEK